MLFSRPMTHVFISPHPDDAALSCGGLITSLRELGQSVTILTVYSGTSGHADAVEYQRVATGFGTKAVWPATQTFDRSNIAAEYPVSASVAAAPPWAADPERLELTQERADTQTRQFWQRAAWTRSANITNEPMDGRPLRDDVATQGVESRYDFSTGDPVEIRRAEDERYAYFAETALVDLDLPDAVHRGYEGDEALLGAPDADDEPPIEILRREIMRLEPQQVYFPLGVGGHVDHRLCRDAGLALLEDGESWVMPSPDMARHSSFYEDFPYAWWTGFDSLADLSDQDVQLPEGLSLEARYSDISDQVERKSAGVRIYASQVQRLFDDEQGMLDAVTGYAARVAQSGGVDTGAAERYWSVTPA
jgi:LmbE family N-acetylglucosaminyl deacetylase